MTKTALVENPNLPASGDMVKKFQGSKSNFLKVPDNLVKEQKEYVYLRWKELVQSLEFKLTKDKKMLSIVGSIYKIFATPENRKTLTREKEFQIKEGEDLKKKNSKLKELNDELKVFGLHFKELKIERSEVFLDMNLDGLSEDERSIRSNYGLIKSEREEVPLPAERAKNKYGQPLLLPGTVTINEYDNFIKDLLRNKFMDVANFEVIDKPDESLVAKIIEDKKVFKVLLLDKESFRELIKKFTTKTAEPCQREDWYKIDFISSKAENSKHDKFFQENQSF
mmetsp:Transcript_38909/g.59121  ORF Transcript_38909/g.59121 Transcript_38909/m.59121 type:complete len:281 (+) Transcript_38909:4734-5576(+)